MDFLGIPRNSKLLLPVDYLVKNSQEFPRIPRNLRKENENGKLISIPRNSQEFLGFVENSQESLGFFENSKESLGIPGINNQDWGLGLDYQATFNVFLMKIPQKSTLQIHCAKLFILTRKIQQCYTFSKFFSTLTKTIRDNNMRNFNVLRITYLNFF